MTMVILRIDCTVWGVNAERRMRSPYERAQLVEEVKTAAWAEAKRRFPRVRLRPPVRVVVQPFQGRRGKLGDVATGCVPTYKAFQDGVVLAGLLPDDGPEVVVEVAFLPPLRADRSGMTLTIEEVG